MDLKAPFQDVEPKVILDNIRCDEHIWNSSTFADKVLNLYNILPLLLSVHPNFLIELCLWVQSCDCCV
jgi:hypothetical protein